MRRKRGREGKERAMYWWNEEIRSLREAAKGTRRKLTRYRSRYRGTRNRELEKQWSADRKRLKKAILAAKRSAWQEMVKSFDEEPWGKPYKMVRDKLIRELPPLESMSLEEAKEILEHLFPRDEEGFESAEWAEKIDNGEWDDAYKVDKAEVRKAIKRASRGGGKTPGLDGITSPIWKKVIEVAPEIVARVLTKCMKERIFPRTWKNGKLVLIKKPGKRGVDLSEFRLIYLINEGAKLLERIMVERIWRRVNEIKERYKGIAPRQFGFRQGRSTIHAMEEMEKIIRQGEDRGWITIVISVDIRNAINSLSWGAIAGALERNSFPGYLSGMVLNYLNERRITYTGMGGRTDERIIDREVPQGSALGPLLCYWAITQL